jgi:protein-disulfide isomerase-like protein with CxxC motif
MSGAIEEAIQQMPDVTWDFLLGGVNTHATHPIGDYGRRLLLHLFREVHATTGQTFSFNLPDEFVYNSTLCCVAVHVVRDLIGRPPFGYLHRLQQLFYSEGVNINDADVLIATAVDQGLSAEEVRERLSQPRYTELARFEFDTAREYGTNALPNVLWEQDGQRSLIGGGYMDSQTLLQAIELKRNSQPPV